MLDWSALGTFAGGIGLFLLGMHLMTDGLKRAAGNALHRILVSSTKTRLRALLSGITITGIVHSSSAVTVATIGFVNVGLLDLPRAIWVIFGSNVGTTVTGWLVALSGVDLDLAPLALPGIALGMLLWLTGGEKRRGAIGLTVVGFGLFFLGLAFMKDAFASLATVVDPSRVQGTGPVSVLSFVGVGLVLTVAMQSSSASLAIAITAAGSGVVSMADAAGWIVGANLGTTSTAALSVIGATPNARRAAMAHVIFNVLAAVVALGLLPVMLATIDLLLDVSVGTASAQTSLAVFHTAFNLVGVLLAWPLSGRLVRFLEKRFESREEEASTPRYLDQNVLAVPELALEAARRETGRLAHEAAECVALACADAPANESELARQRQVFDALLGAISSFLTRLDHKSVSVPVAAGLQALVRTSSYLTIAVEQAAFVTDHRNDEAAHEAGSKTIPSVLAAAREVIELADPESERFQVPAAQQALGVLSERHRLAETEYTQSAARGARGAQQAIWRQHLLTEVRRGAKYLVLAAQALEEARTTT
jgi:phosphate:Na+ symporter